jgi:hemolysin activation/secretion protein
MYLLLQDLPGVKVMPVTLGGAGVGVGQTALEVTTLQSTPPVEAAFSADNYGIPATGSARFGSSVSANNLLHFGDTLEAGVLTTSKHQLSGHVGASAPLGNLGWRVQGSFTHSLYSVSSVDSSGTADTGTLGLAYPLVRALDQNWTFAMDGVDTTSSQKVAGIQAFAPRHLYSVRFTLSTDAGDRSMQLGESYWTALLALTHGRVAQSLDSADTTGVLGVYDKLAMSAVGKLNLGSTGWYGVLIMHGQLADRNLDYSEKLSIGGQGGVRAYRADEGSLDEGIVVSAELRRLFHLPNGDQLSPGIFVDYANGVINHSPYGGWQTSSGYVDPNLSNHRSVAALGVGVDWQSHLGVSASLSWATRMPGSKDSINYPGSARNRVLLSLSYRF